MATGIAGRYGRPCHYPGGAGYRTAVQPGSPGVGLSGSARQSVGTDMPPVLDSLDSGLPCGHGTAPPSVTLSPLTDFLRHVKIFPFPHRSIRGCGGIGRLIGFRFQRVSVQVRVLSSAPNEKRGFCLSFYFAIETGREPIEMRRGRALPARARPRRTLIFAIGENANRVLSSPPKIRVH